MRSTALLIPLAIVPLTGCAAAVVAAAAGTFGLVQYDRNKAHRDFEVDLETAWEATHATADEFGFKNAAILEHTVTEVEIQDEDFWARVERHPEGFTCVAVRFGRFDTEDHQRRSKLFLNAVAERLGEEPDTSG